MITQIWVVLAAMVAAFVLAKWKLTVEMSLLAAAVAGAMAGAMFGTPPLIRVPYHLVNGSLAYLDVVLVFVTATFLMEVMTTSGGANWVIASIVRRFGRNRALTMILLMLVMLIPGALSGVGTTALVMLGAPVAAVLQELGISRQRVAGILFILASLGAVAPPVNLWAMIGCAGGSIPYVGFELPLALPVLVLGGFTLLVLGRSDKPESRTGVGSATLAAMPEVAPDTTWWRVVTPFILLIVLMIAYRIWPFQVPALGLPLQFAIAGAAAWLLAKKKQSVLVLTRDAVERVLPLIGTTLAVGMAQEVMACTGVRGLLSFSLLSMPITLLFLLLPVTMPVAGGLLAFGVAAVFGAPLLWFFQFLGMNLTISLSGLSLLWALGTALPPTAIIGRFTVLVTQYDGPYTRFLRSMWLPWLAITIVGTLMVVFSTKLSFLAG